MPEYLDVVIVGMGKAGQGHYTCYEQLAERFPVRVFAIVDPQADKREISRRVFNPFIVNSFELLDGYLQSHPVLLDICASTRSFDYSGFSTDTIPDPFVVIEKPLYLKRSTSIKWFSQYLAMFIAEHYLYSEVTTRIRTLIGDLKLRPYFVHTNFRNNRLADMGERHDCPGKPVPHVFDIEMPHQVSLAVSFLGDIMSIEKAVCCLLQPFVEMRSKHIEGILILKHKGGAISTHRSSLQSLDMRRLIKVECQDDIAIVGEYSSDPEYNGKVTVLQGDEMVMESPIHDDSLKRTLELVVTLRTDSVVNHDAILKENRHLARELTRVIQGAMAQARYCEHCHGFQYSNGKSHSSLAKNGIKGEYDEILASIVG